MFCFNRSHAGIQSLRETIDFLQRQLEVTTQLNQKLELDLDRERLERQDMLERLLAVWTPRQSEPDGYYSDTPPDAQPTSAYAGEPAPLYNNIGDFIRQAEFAEARLAATERQAMAMASAKKDQTNNGV